LLYCRTPSRKGINPMCLASGSYLHLYTDLHPSMAKKRKLGNGRTRRYEGRHCSLCSVSCGPHYELSEKDRGMLEVSGCAFHPPRPGFSWYLCGPCAAGVDGIAERMSEFALMVSTGILFFVQRVFPQTASLDSTSIRKIRRHMKSASFKDTRHGAADWRLDRLSLYLYGPVADMYQDSHPSEICFAVMFIRCCCNDSDALQLFFGEWSSLGRGRLSPRSWDEDQALELLKMVWRPRQHDMGYTCRMMPQCGQLGQFQQSGCQLMSDVSARLLAMRVKDFPWRGPRSNDRTKAFIAKVIDAPTGGFWTVVVARDLGILLPTSGDVSVFESSSCDDLGMNGKNGIDVLVPTVGGKARPYNRQGNRLGMLQSMAEPLIRELLGDKVLEHVPPIDDLQVYEHNACEWMQQHTRDKTNSGEEKANNIAKPLRCDDELRVFAKSALPRLGGKRVPLVSSTKDGVSNQELLRALRRVAPRACHNGEWDSKFVQRLAAHARGYA
jgi:hypothetical protein